MTMTTSFDYMKPVPVKLSSLAIGAMFIDPLQLSSPQAPLYVVATEMSAGGDVGCMVAATGQDLWSQASLPGGMDVLAAKEMSVSVVLKTS